MLGAALVGVATAVAVLAVLALLQILGLTRAAGVTAQAIFLLSLAGAVITSVGSPPTRLRRARVPVSRQLPPAWWPPEPDAVPLLAACVAAPIAIGSAAAMWVLR